MPPPADPDARRFYQAAVQRLADARALLKVDRPTGAVYLGGYSVECVLKALILTHTSRGRRAGVVATFRGTAAHDFGWLRTRYLRAGGAEFDPVTLRALGRVGFWKPNLRYEPGVLRVAAAADFLAAVESIWAAADRRLGS